MKDTVYYLPGMGGHLNAGLGQAILDRGFQVIGRETLGEFQKLSFQHKIDTIADDLKTHFWYDTPHRVGSFEIRCLGKNRTTVSQIFALNAVSGATDLAVQRTIGETITLLNSFGTPRFVFERIFSSPNLYAFTEAEMAELNTVSSLDEM